MTAETHGVSEEGAGIGGGHAGDCWDVTITGGTINATGGIQSGRHPNRGGAGIGGGMDGGNLIGVITISGGIVNATGQGGGAGIGAGWGGNASKGTVNITDGKVTAIGGAFAAGIGGGCEGVWGGGGEGANVSISGNADVYAESGGGKSSAIGHGDDDREYGTLKIADNMMVQAGWSDECDERKPAFAADERVTGKTKRQPMPDRSL